MIGNSIRTAGVIAALGLLAGCASQASQATPAYTYLPVVCAPTAATPTANGAGTWTEPGTTPASSTTPANPMQGCYVAVPSGYDSAGDYVGDYGYDYDDGVYPYLGYGGVFVGGFGHGFHDHGFHGGGFHGGGFHGGGFHGGGFGGGFHGGGGGGHGR